MTWVVDWVVLKKSTITLTLWAEQETEQCCGNVKMSACSGSLLDRIDAKITMSEVNVMSCCQGTPSMLGNAMRASWRTDETTTMVDGRQAAVDKLLPMLPTHLDTTKHMLCQIKLITRALRL